MSNEDDVFLKTFTQMIDLLKTIHVTIDSLKKSVEIIQLSIDGLGKGLTNANSNLVELNSSFELVASRLDNITVSAPATKPDSPKKSKTPAKTTTKPKKETEAKTAKAPPQTAPSTSAQHPIFIDLVTKLNTATNFKEVGDFLIEALEQIESNFSFSRVFYEIRRIGNSLIRKGEKDFPPNEKTELIEKLLDWESRLVE